MTDEEHRYNVRLTWFRNKIVNVYIDGKKDFKVATPIDFWPDSPPDVLSPEDLFLASAVTCYGVSLSGVAKRFHAELSDFSTDQSSFRE